MTLSAAEKRWSELLQVLYKYHYNKDITVEQAMKLDDCTKTLLIRNDPSMCSQYFNHKTKAFMKCLTKATGCFDEYVVTDSFVRTEFQLRGSPHDHEMFWFENAPKFDPDRIVESTKEVVQFIDRFITCKNDSNNPYVTYQNHRHTFTCLKGKKRECRFGIPLPMMPETKILMPLEPSELQLKSQGRKDYKKKIQKLMRKIWKDKREVSFEEVLAELRMTQEEYEFIIRCTLKSLKIFLKRGSLDVGTNAYNRDVLCLFESNMDIQFVLDEFALLPIL